jgi:Fis family transcriptional regulator
MTFIVRNWPSQSSVLLVNDRGGVKIKMQTVQESLRPTAKPLSSELANGTEVSKLLDIVNQPELAGLMDRHSIEHIVEFKISRFFDQIGSYYPDNVHELIMNKVEKPLLVQILKRVGGNQVHASRILGINRNTLRKKMKLYGL